MERLRRARARGRRHDQPDAAAERVTGAVAEAPDFTLAAGALSKARAELADQGVAVVPLDTDLEPDGRTTRRATCARRSNPGETVDGVTPYLAGQPAAWAGLQELSKEDLDQAEQTGFPIVALILLAVFGSLAAASLPLVARLRRR